MKKLFFAFVSVFVSGQAMAIYGGPYLSVTKGPGFTPPEYAHTIECAIYPNQIVVTRTNRVTGLKSVEKREFNVTMGKLMSTIAEASQGEIENVGGPVDGPTSVYMAYHVLPNDAVRKIVLLTDGFGRNQVNKSQKARLLKNFADLHCN